MVVVMDFFFKMDDPGIDPGTSRMLSKRSTILAGLPMENRVHFTSTTDPQIKSLQNSDKVRPVKSAVNEDQENYPIALKFYKLL